MADQSTIQSLGFARPAVAELFSLADESLADGQFRVKTLYSGFSAAAELALFDGTSPDLHARWDDDLRAFVPAQPTIHYPIIAPGYMEVGRVMESRTPVVAVGQLVAMEYGHRSAYTADPRRERFIPLPPDLDPLLGILVASVGPACANSLLHAADDRLGTGARELGDGVRGRRVLVVGDDVAALLTALFSLYGGAAEVALAATQSAPLALASELGVQALDDATGAAWLTCKQRWTHAPGDRGADVAFSCGTRGTGLHTALRGLRPAGTLVISSAAPGSGVPDASAEAAFRNAIRVRHAPLGGIPSALASLWDRRGLSMETVYLLQEYGSHLLNSLRAGVVPLTAGPAALADLAAGSRQPFQLTFAFSA